VGRTGDTSRIRYSADDPTNVVGAGRESLVVNILTPLVFAFIAIYAAAMTYRRMRDRPRAALITYRRRSRRQAK
jgi:hypothetical protein